MAEVTLEAISKHFGDEVAVEDIDLTVNDGEVLGVIGPSGCGKTTTLRTIAGFETPTTGHVFFDETEVTHIPPEDRNVGLVFQNYALFNNMSVLDNVAFGLKMQGVKKGARRERAMELLELVGIEEHADRNPRYLSGGQQQRVGLARALAIEPNILLLDEPMTGLDAKLKDRLKREIGALLDDIGVTALYVTHDQEEAMVMCDRIAVMNNGRVEQVGTPREVYESPANQFVAEFVGTANLIDATVQDGEIDLGFVSVPAPSLGDESGAVRLVIRPDAIEIGEGPITATVRDLFFAGEAIQATAELPSGEEISLNLDRSDGRIAEGDTIQLSLDATKLHVMD